MLVKGGSKLERKLGRDQDCYVCADKEVGFACDVGYYSFLDKGYIQLLSIKNFLRLERRPLIISS